MLAQALLKHLPMAYKVLVIEDNTDCRELFATIIRHLGFQVIEADDGEVGVQKALAEKPDLIFMDLGMPSIVESRRRFVCARARLQKMFQL